MACRGGASAEPVDTGPELLANGTFESVSSSGYPTQWSQFNSALPVAATTTSPYDGSYSLKLEDPSASAQLGLRSAQIPVTPGLTYRASVSANVSASAGGPDLYLEFWDGAGRIQVDTKRAAPLGEWQKLTIAKTAPANALYATVLIYGSTAYAGTSYFDNASLVAIPEPSTAPQLLANAGFETASGAAAAQWSQFNAASPVGISTFNAYAGTNSVKLADTTVAGQLGLRSAQVAVVPGASYEASVLAYLPPGQTEAPDLYLEFWDNAGTRILTETVRATASNDWQRMTARKTAPVNAAFATVLLYGSSAYAGTAYFDQASLTRGPELLANGGFELASGGNAVQWSQLNNALPVGVATTQVRTGSNSVKLEDPSPAAQPGLRSAKVPVTPGQAYRATVYAYVSATDGGPDLYLEFWDSAGARIKVDAKRANPAAEWQKMTIRQAAPANAVSATLLLNGNSAYAGTTYFDDASLVAIPLAELKKLPNGDFEESVAGWPSDWTQAIASRPGVTATDLVYEGTRSAKLSNADPSGGSGLRSAKVPVTAGSSYRASVRNYIVSGSPHYYLEFWDAAGKRIAVYIQSGQTKGQWQPLSVEAEAPPGAVAATIYLLSNGISNSYFDNAAIEEIAPEPVRTFPVQTTGHPRLYFGSADIPALQAKAADTTAGPTGQTGQQLWSKVKQAADNYLAETNSFSITYIGGKTVAFSLPPAQPGHIDPPPGFSGAYPYWTSMAKEIENRLEAMSLAYVVTGDSAYGNKAKSYVLALAAWNNWSDPEYECGGTCLDTVHFTLGVSAAYDMLYSLFTPAERTQIETALENKGLIPLYINTLAKIDGNGQITKAAALAAGASVLHGSNPNTNKYLTRAFNYMQWYLDQRLVSGQNEGFLYTAYSTDMVLKAIDQTARVTGTSELLDHPFLKDFTVRWANYFLAPGGAGLAAFSDSLYGSYFFTTMSILNNRLNDGFAGYYLTQAQPAATEIMDNFLYYNPNGAVVQPTGKPTSAVLPEIGWAALRSGWEKTDTLLAFQSNNFATGHNHHDQNSFQLSVNGSWIGRDPGYQDFPAGTIHDFTTDMGHSTIQVDGLGQSSLGGGALTPGMTSPTYDYVKGSAAGAYLNPKLEKFDRHIVYVKPNYYVMLDDLQADAPRDFDWVLFGGPLLDYQVDGASVAPGQTAYGNDVFVQNGSAQLSAKFLSASPLPITVSTYSGADKYGYQVKVRSGDQKQTNYRFLTVLKAAPFDHAGYYQAEDLIGQMSTSASVYGKVNGAGTQYLQLNMDEVGDYASFTVETDTEGDYAFATTFMESSTNYGIVQAYVDGQPIGSAIDDGIFGAFPTKPQVHGTVHLTAGTHTLRYEVAGKNPNAAGYSFGIDAIRLVPAGTEAIDAKMQTDAELLEGTNATGARIERGDGSAVTDYVLFRTAAGSYSLADVGSDADQSVVSRNSAGAFAGYAMTRGDLA
ncbi:carbohydrate binding domain-containing protein [Cohnella rhizosphaerae]|uniref:Carbohydrate binding domain-containing protein n=1 Tax=Cohnella rhizosphaerae TaxID=1457232 RepID=A0A9X4KUG3_9BACL|nr:carbohydrate binding domain-containing protein [Cohnella rhizosphaerae]MDG0811245.1 carbohydrate binding domain-containing protein [Cohnella rhizosphaerae]